MKKRHFAVALIFLLIYGIVLYVVDQGRTGSAPSVEGASDSATQTGTLAFRRLWLEMGYGYKRWEEPPYFLSDSEHGVFVSVNPSDQQYGSKAVTALLAWAGRGHHIVWVTDQSDTMMHSLNLHVSAATHVHVHQVEVYGRGTQTRSLATWKPLQFTSSSVLRGVGLQRARLTYQSTTGNTIGALLPYGRGDVTIWTVPEVWENQAIGQSQNLLVPWSIVSHRNLLWDEYGHGVVSGGMLQVFVSQGRAPAFGLLALALLLYIWTSLDRFGRPIQHEEEGPRLGTEFMRAFAWHLKSSRLRDDAVRLLARSVRRRISRTIPGAKEMTLTDLSSMLPRYFSRDVVQAYEAWSTTMEQPKHHKRSWQSACSQTKTLLDAVAQDEGQAAN